MEISFFFFSNNNNNKKRTFDLYLRLKWNAFIIVLYGMCVFKKKKKVFTFSKLSNKTECIINDFKVKHYVVIHFHLCLYQKTN